MCEAYDPFIHTPLMVKVSDYSQDSVQIHHEDSRTKFVLISSLTYSLLAGNWFSFSYVGFLKLGEIFSSVCSKVGIWAGIRLMFNEDGMRGRTNVEFEWFGGCVS